MQYQALEMQEDCIVYGSIFKLNYFDPLLCCLNKDQATDQATLYKESLVIYSLERFVHVLDSRHQDIIQ